MSTINLNVPQENIQEIAETVENRLFERITKWMTENAPNRYLTAKQITKTFGISDPTIIEWRKKKIITGYKLGCRIFYRWDQIENAMQEIN